MADVLKKAKTVLAKAIATANATIATLEGGATMTNRAEPYDAAETAAGITIAIQMLLRDHDDPVRATVITEILADWLGSFDNERQPYMLAKMTAATLGLMGHEEVRTEVHRGDGEAEIVSDTIHSGTKLTVGPVKHMIADSEEVRASVDLVIQKARDLNLHGVVILSPICTECGTLHDFAMISDLSHGAGGELARLLQDFAASAAKGEDDPRPVSHASVQ